MRRTAIAIIAFLSASAFLFAQGNEPKETFKYSNITECGFITTSPQGFGLEITTVQGVSINKSHHWGLGLGFGGNFYKATRYSDSYYGYPNKEPYLEDEAYMPIFVNYRYYFKPNKTFSPHINASLGGIVTGENGGLYSSVTMGFRYGKFSFSSGISFNPVYRKYEKFELVEYTDPWGDVQKSYRSEPDWKWFFPFGITLKWGVAF